MKNNIRIKTPTVIQMEAVECGAASLGIILGYFGNFVPLEELRAECGVSRDGSRASNVAKAAKKYGLGVKGYFFPEDSDIRDIFDETMPIIVFWRNNHFLVVEGIKKDKVYLNDPAFGPRIVNIKEFADSFSKVYLTFKKTDSFKKSPPQANIFKGLFSRLEGSKKSLIFTLVVSVSLVVPGIVIPGLSKVFIDEYMLKANHSYLHPIISMLILFSVISGVLLWIQHTLLIKLETKLLINSSYRFMLHLLRLPMLFFSQRSSGDVINRLQSNATIANLLSGQMASTFFNFIQVLFYGIIMWLYSWILTVLLISFALVNVIVYKATKKKKRDVGFRVQETYSKMVGTTMVGNSIIESLKSSGNEGDFFIKWSGYQAKYTNAEQNLSWLEMFTAIIPVLCKGLSSAFVLGIGAYLIIKGDMTIGGLVAFTMLAAQFDAPINNLVNFGNLLQQISVDIKRLDDVHDYTVDEKFQKQNKIPKTKKGECKLSGHLKLNNIFFGYSKLEPPLIEEFSLNLEPGKRVALVGTSGSGKSTVAKLITGLYKPWGGEILFDGENINTVPVDVLANSVAMVDQNPFFFKGTIRDNISMWGRNVPDDKIYEITRKAEIFKDISVRKGGFDTDINESGTNFSGGQLQRLEIARALLSDPSILILDEATSALDPVVENRIYRNLWGTGCAFLIIAHRLSTIRDCDEIIVLSKGKIVERGKHDSLIALKKYYYELVTTE